MPKRGEPGNQIRVSRGTKIRGNSKRGKSAPTERRHRRRRCGCTFQRPALGPGSWKRSPSPRTPGPSSRVPGRLEDRKGAGLLHRLATACGRKPTSFGRRPAIEGASGAAEGAPLRGGASEAALKDGFCESGARPGESGNAPQGGPVTSASPAHATPCSRHEASEPIGLGRSFRRERSRRKGAVHQGESRAGP